MIVSSRLRKQELHKTIAQHRTRKAAAGEVSLAQRQAGFRAATVSFPKRERRRHRFRAPVTQREMAARRNAGARMLVVTVVSDDTLSNLSAEDESNIKVQAAGRRWRIVR